MPSPTHESGASPVTADVTDLATAMVAMMPPIAAGSARLCQSSG